VENDQRRPLADLAVVQARVPDGPDLASFIDAVCDSAALGHVPEIDRRYPDRPR